MTGKYAWRIRRTDGVNYDKLTLGEGQIMFIEETPSLYADWEVSIVTW